MTVISSPILETGKENDTPKTLEVISDISKKKLKRGFQTIPPVNLHWVSRIPMKSKEHRYNF